MIAPDRGRPFLEDSTMSRERLSGLLVLLTVATVPLVADTIVMRDGRRVSGTLVSVRSDTIEFDERGYGNNRRLRLERRDAQTGCEIDHPVAPESWAATSGPRVDGDQL